ncbi:hypothetical protein [Burkholderia glumae]|uniref:hypothetical protein n=1 Tax=Burkholderia glumae TaxID=337 RepID=UPI002151EE74|nr:hypothetical protein [Burkholderia glumae]
MDIADVFVTLCLLTADLLSDALEAAHYSLERANYAGRGHVEQAPRERRREDHHVAQQHLFIDERAAELGRHAERHACLQDIACILLLRCMSERPLSTAKITGHSPIQAMVLA